MTDEPSPSPHSGASTGALLRAVEELRADARDFRTEVRQDIGHLRDDVREDNDRLEKRVMAVVTDLRAEQRTSVEAHSKRHLEAAIDTETELGRIRDFMATAELSKARRDGALGVFRFAVEQVSRHSGPIVRVLLAAAGALAFITGAVHIEVVAK